MKKRSYKLQFSCWINRFELFCCINLDKHEQCCLNDDQYFLINGGKDDDSNEIYEKQPTLSRKWIPGAINATYVLNKSKDWIFILGGRMLGACIDAPWWSKDEFFEHDLINVYDINKREFHKCSIKCPVKGSMYAICMINEREDELLVNGFVNDSYRGKKWRNLLLCPSYLIKLIKKYVFIEYIHIFGKSDRGDISRQQHFKINTDHLIESIMTESMIK